MFSINEYKAFLFDEETAKKRIIENKSSIGTISDLILCADDFKRAEQMHAKETGIVAPRGEITEKGVFLGALYCLMTSLQDYETQERMFSAFLKEGLDGPSPILSEFDVVSSLFQKSIFRNQKLDYIRDLCENWFSYNLPQEIKERMGNGREAEIELRKDITKKIKGFGEKTASLLLRMSGAESLVPIDTWMNNVLYMHGYPVTIPRSKAVRSDENKIKERKRAITGKKYLEAEEFSLDLAEKYNVPGHLLQLAYWTKYSSFKKTV